MIRFPLIVSLCILIAPSVSANSWPDFPIIVAEGRALLEVAPEKVDVRLEVIAFDEDSAIAVDTVETQLGDVLAVLSRFDIPAEAITSHDLEKRIERARHDYKNLDILGYNVSRSLKFELEDLAKFSDLIGALAGINNVSIKNAYFDVLDRSEHERELMNQAAEDARQQAENMAAGLGVELGDVFAVSESGYVSRTAQFALSIGDGPYPMMADSASPGGLGRSVFMPSTIEMTQTLNVIFRIQDR